MTALPELDPVIHAQARLRVTAALASLHDGDRITFPRLQELLEMTAGNLSTHLRKLEDAGYVEVTKSHERRTPVTYLILTRDGRRAFEDYTTAVRALLNAAAATAEQATTGPGTTEPATTGPATARATTTNAPTTNGSTP